jgi:hypothetical protein
MLRIHKAALAALLVTQLTAPAAAQQSSTVTQVDIQQLQDNLYQVTADVAQLRSRDAARAGRLQAELDELREEVISTPALSTA